MPRKPMHPCRHYGCACLTYNTYCAEHEELHRGEYNKYCRRIGYKEAYGTAWRKIRKEYVKRHPLCERCLKKGRYVPVDIVHHIVPVSVGGTSDDDNLMSVCRSCHEWIHKHEIGDKGY